MVIFKKYKTLKEIVPDFLSDVRKQIELRSYQGYLGKMRVFNDWTGKNGLDETPLRKMTNTDMESFFNYLTTERENGKSDSDGNPLIGLDQPTCKKYKDVLHKLWEYAQKRGEVDSFPFDLITFPKKGQDMSSELIPTDHLKVLVMEMKRRDPQLYLASMTEFYCFIRPGTELRLLKVADVDLDNGLIQVITDHAKNGHKRIITMPTQLVDIYREQEIGAYPKEFYLLGNRHKPGLQPLSINMLRYRFNIIRDDLNMPKGYKFYSFKHTGATILHNSNTVSLREVMDQLGHSRLSSTEHYIKKHGGVMNVRIRDNFPNPFAVQVQ